MTTAFQNNAFQLDAFQIGVVSGYISANDSPDTAALEGTVSGTVEVYGTISATDQNDVATLLGTITSANVPDTHDGFTKEEYKRYKKLQKKIAQAEAQIVQARLDKRLARKQLIKDLVDPTQVKESEVNSVSEVKIDKPSIDLKKLNATIINLQRQQQQLLKTVELRNQIARAQAQLAIHEAQMAAERDDEEALLLLM